MKRALREGRGAEAARHSAEVSEAAAVLRAVAALAASCAVPLPSTAPISEAARHRAAIEAAAGSGARLDPAPGIWKPEPPVAGSGRSR